MRIAKLNIYTVALLLCSACSQHELEVFESVSGENAPGQFGVSIYANSQEMDAAWIQKALGKSKYENLRSKVDFNSQRVIVAAVGKRSNFSGRIEISRIYQYTGVDAWPLNINVNVGTSTLPCEGHINASPFVIAIVEKPERGATIGGMDFQNFPDDCRELR